MNAADVVIDQLSQIFEGWDVANLIIAIAYWVPIEVSSSSR